MFVAYNNEVEMNCPLSMILKKKKIVTFLNAVTRARKQNSKQGRPFLVRWLALVFNTFISESDKFMSMLVPWQ